MTVVRSIIARVCLVSGVTLSSYGLGYDQGKKSIFKIKNPYEQLTTAVKIASSSGAVSDATVVRLLNANKERVTTMYGRQVNDTLSGEPGRKEYNVHPYGKFGGGVTVAAVYTDKKSNEVRLLLGKKNNGNQYILLGGYGKPHPLEGGLYKVDTLSEEQRDHAEEAILSGSEGYQTLPNQSYKTNTKITTKIKELYDKSLEQTAIRELQEEAGINSSKATISLLGARSDCNTTNDERLHTIVLDYMADFGVQEAEPPTQAGSDIKKVVWVKMTDIVKNPSVPVQPYGSKISRYQVRIGENWVDIRDDHGTPIEQCAAKFSQEISASSDGKSGTGSTATGTPTMSGTDSLLLLSSARNRGIGR